MTTAATQTIPVISITAACLPEAWEKAVRVGRYVDIRDSLHIYGSYLKEAAVEIEKMRRTPFVERAWESTHPAFEMMTLESREKLTQDPDWFAKARG